ncbi:bacteriophage lambda tail assembly I [Enterobacter hormaechei]|nr:bacteriophage lambda tail assembly I [Enterobacter hormaechei]
MERKTVIKLSGSMAQRFGRTHRRALTSASEVFRALSNTIDGFDAICVKLGQRDWILLFSGIVAIWARRV